MPLGLVIMHWDERVGVTVVAAYPEEISIQEKTLMQLYSQHEFTGEAGMVTLMAGAINLLPTIRDQILRCISSSF